jgi:hypothetical protein
MWATRSALIFGPRLLRLSRAAIGSYCSLPATEYRSMGQKAAQGSLEPELAFPSERQWPEYQHRSPWGPSACDFTAFRARDGGLVHVSGRVNGWHDRHRAHTAAPRFQSPVTRVKRRKRRHRFSAIRMRSLNDARRGSLPTVQTVKPLRRLQPRHLHEVQTDASVTIRLLIPTPAQWVSQILAETDGLAVDA